MKNAFTMIEVIFVIVIIGILAAVAIPKLQATRDNAEAAMCVHEVGQLIHEITSGYTKVGYSVFKNSAVSTMTNIDTSGGTQGIKEDTTVDTTGIIYKCDGKDIVNIVGHNVGGEYNLIVTLADTAGFSPVPLMVSQEVFKNVMGGDSSKIFKL